jgi:alginate O-acetyltransferase complex protein AlgI
MQAGIFARWMISPIFLLYFLPFFLLGYRLIPSRFRNSFILLASILFYAWGAPRFIFLLLLTSFADFHLVRLMANQQDSKRRYFLAGSLALNLGLLVVFKYVNFFAENFEPLLGSSGWKMIGLPLGISFFLIETITYVVDVYRREQEPLDRFFDYLLYILFFPKLLAGPIVRYGQIAGQLRDRSASETPQNFIEGFFRFVIGLGKNCWLQMCLGIS